MQPQNIQGRNCGVQEMGGDLTEVINIFEAGLGENHEVKTE